MDRYSHAKALIDELRPERPVLGLRPHAAGRAARWFLTNFPGEVAYAYKANSSVFLVGSLYGAGIRNERLVSVPAPAGSESVWHLYPVLVSGDRDAFMAQEAAARA